MPGTILHETAEFWVRAPKTEVMRACVRSFVREFLYLFFLQLHLFVTKIDSVVLCDISQTFGSLFLAPIAMNLLVFLCFALGGLAYVKYLRSTQSTRGSAGCSVRSRKTALLELPGHR